MRIILNDLEWKLKGFWPYVPLLGKSIELKQDLMGVTEWIGATVPGGVHKDLLDANIIKDPYYEMNSLECEWVENRWWMYKTSFNFDKISYNNIRLVFAGVDYKAYFFLNGIKIGEHEGCYEPAVFDVTDIISTDEKNELTVLFEHAPQEMSQIGYTSQTSTQKSRFNYKWDFSTRLVNVGIWGDVYLDVSKEMRIEDIAIDTCLNESNNSAKIDVSYQVQAYQANNISVVMELYKDTMKVGEKKNKLDVFNLDEVTTLKESFFINNCELWYPNGYGEQPLYLFVLKLLCDDEEIDCKSVSFGIKSIKYKKNENSPEDALPYTFEVNNCNIYIKGVNLVPFDHLYGTITKEQYEEYIKLLKYANINLVRVWGGGIIEKEIFYALCDKYGIMVWQEFIQSSSGIDNCPSENEKFLELLSKTAVHAVKRIRNHVCHVVWSGGNELREKNDIPATYQNSNINMLNQIVKKYDSRKLFLPTSASGPNEFLDITTPGKNHDVHGPWKYQGAVDHYTLFNKSDSLFHSEFGVDGCSNLVCLRNSLSEKNLVVTSMKDNLVWRHHGEWWDTYERDTTLFGEITSIDKFVQVSQLMQAEGLRYALEANQRRMYQNSGSIIWHFNDPWPNVSSTALVDYYKIPKMSYYWVKDAYSLCLASLSYSKLFYENEEFIVHVFLHNNSNIEQQKMVKFQILDIYGRKYYEKNQNYSVSKNKIVEIMSFCDSLPKFDKDIFFVRLIVSDGKQQSSKLYFFSQKEKNPFQGLCDLGESMLEVSYHNNKAIIKNVSNVVCLFAHIDFLEIPKDGVYVKNNYVTLFPDESTELLIESLDDRLVKEKYCVKYLNSSNIF